jgi:hypothetical protein
MTSGKDRPIGIDAYVHDPGTVQDLSRIYWVDQRLTITRAKIEAFLDGPPTPGLAPGIIAMPLVDTDTRSHESRLEGHYTLFLRVERLP